MDDHEGDIPLEDESMALLVHELRGPLTVIVGYLDMLDKPLDLEERSAVVGAVRRAAMRLDRMLDDVAEGRGPTCAARLQMSRVSLRDVVTRVAVDWTAGTGRVIEIVGDANPSVDVDEQRFEAVLGNLLANAGKYSPPDSPIVVRITLSATMASVAVEDEGPGIPEADRGRVLGRFERLDRDSDAPGSGLGLAVVRETVEAFGGAVVIGSSEAGGASIRIELPRVQ